MLEILDKAVCHDPEAIKAAVMDKAYMVQLVQVQKRRGAQGGQMFSSVLTSNEESVLEDTVEDYSQSPKKIKLSLKGIIIIKCKHNRNNIIIFNIFASDSESWFSMSFELVKSG